MTDAPLTRLSSNQHNSSINLTDGDPRRRVLSVWAGNRDANIDTLTGLGNRQAAHDRVAHLLSNRAADIHCLFVDVDDFKCLNRHFGYEAGDDALISVANVLAATLAKGWHLSRFAGGEFVALGTRPLTAVEAEGLLSAKICPTSPGHETWTRRLSIGVTSLPAAIASPTTLFREASNALQRAKESPHRRLVEMTDETRISELMAMELGRDVRQALEEGQIVPYAQSIVELATGRVVGLEVLARWNSPTGALILPDVFVPSIEESGLAVVLGRQMIAHAIEALSSLTKQGDTETYVTVNLSAQHLQERTLPRDLWAFLSAAGVEPSRLVLEITESQQIQDTDSAWRATAHALRELNIGLAIDDFGTGYSSIAQLIALPFSHVKVDRTITGATRACEDDLMTTIASFAATFARSAGMKPIAEGIETLQDKDAMITCGYRHGQGFLFDHPRPIAEAISDVLF